MVPVREIMVADAVTVEPQTSLAEAARLMLKRRINCVVVCRGGAEVVGILTPRDVMRGAAGGAGVAGTAALAVERLMTADPITIDAAESMERAFELMDARSVRHLPVVSSGALVGILSVRDLLQHRARLLTTLVERKTFELEVTNAQLRAHNDQMTYALDLAGRVQVGLLPAASAQFGPLCLDVLYRPLARVSGDWYDFTEPGDGRLGILVADTSGHGIPAALVSVMARTIFQAYAGQETAPAAVLSVMNQRLAGLIEHKHFVTMSYATIDRRTHLMTLALAGHPRPLWYRRISGAVEAIECRGDVIGVIDDAAFEERKLLLRPGDVVLFYTDGLVESQNAGGEPFGRARLEAALIEHATGSGTELLAGIERSLDAFCGGSLGDDVTCVALRVSPGP